MVTSVHKAQCSRFGGSPLKFDAVEIFLTAENLFTGHVKCCGVQDNDAPFSLLICFGRYWYQEINGEKKRKRKRKKCDQGDQGDD